MKNRYHGDKGYMDEKERKIMTKILFQGDDFGFTRSVTYGIVDSIDRGVLRNTGLFAILPSAALAVSYMKDRPQACFGIDFNLVSGPSCADPAKIPHLVDEKGNFIRSGVVRLSIHGPCHVPCVPLIPL